MDLTSIGKAIVILGVVLIVVGGLIWVLARAGLPLGRLPGDVRIQRDGFSCFIPIVTMILVSIVLTIILNVIIRLLNR